MTNKPDPGKGIDVSGMSNEAARSARRNARLTAWRREGTKAKRQQAQAARIAAWEKATGMKWEVNDDGTGVSQREGR